MPSITGLVTGAAVNTVENKIFNVSNLAKKLIMRQKYLKLRINILLSFDKFTNEINNAKIKEKESVNKSDLSWFIDKFDLDKKNSNISSKIRIKIKAG